MIYQKVFRARHRVILGCLIVTILLNSHLAPVQSAGLKAVQATSKGEADKKPTSEKAPPAGPVDEYDRGNPRSSLKGYFRASRDGDFELASHYLDMRNLPAWMRRYDKSVLAHKLKVVLDRALWVDLETVSADPEGNLQDGLPSYRDSIGRIKTPERVVDILLQRVPRKDGVFIWKFSNRTVAQIPHMHKYFGYRPHEQLLSEWFPDVTFLGWQSWQWALFVAAIPLAYLVALVPTWVAAILLRRRKTDISQQLARTVTGPIRIVLWFVLIRAAGSYIGLSTALREVQRAGFLMIIAFTWAVIRLVELVFEWWGERLRKAGHEETTVLLKPARNTVKIVVVILAVLVLLDNIGFEVSTLVAGLGVGGLAVALAVQDTLKNFIASVMVLLDKPYQVGQRIVAKGHDGVVEEIGLRSTRMRLLTGHQTIIPNDEMARVDVENIGRRPHIRRFANIRICYDTPLDKVEQAVKIIEDILDNHEGMDSEFPPRVYFNEFNPDSLNILILYWYHPAAYWDFLAFNQRVNMQIMREFEKEGIQFAFPTATTYVTQKDGEALHFSMAGEVRSPDQRVLV